MDNGIRSGASGWATVARRWRSRTSQPRARGQCCDASGDVLGQARDERWRFARFDFGAEVVAVIPFTVAFPGRGLLEGSSAGGAAEDSVGHSALRNVGGSQTLLACLWFHELARMRRQS